MSDKVQQLVAATGQLVNRDCQYLGATIIIPCADHAEALSLMCAVRAALGALANTLTTPGAAA